MRKSTRGAKPSSKLLESKGVEIDGFTPTQVPDSKKLRAKEDLEHTEASPTAASNKPETSAPLASPNSATEPKRSPVAAANSGANSKSKSSSKSKSNLPTKASAKLSISSSSSSLIAAAKSSSSSSSLSSKSASDSTSSKDMKPNASAKISQAENNSGNGNGVSGSKPSATVSASSGGNVTSGKASKRPQKTILEDPLAKRCRTLEIQRNYFKRMLDRMRKLDRYGFILGKQLGGSEAPRGLTTLSQIMEKADQGAYFMPHKMREEYWANSRKIVEMLQSRNAYEDVKLLNKTDFIDIDWDRIQKDLRKIWKWIYVNQPKNEDPRSFWSCGKRLEEFVAENFASARAKNKEELHKVYDEEKLERLTFENREPAMSSWRKKAQERRQYTTIDYYKVVDGITEEERQELEALLDAGDSENRWLLPEDGDAESAMTARGAVKKKRRRANGAASTSQNVLTGNLPFVSWRLKEKDKDLSEVDSWGIDPFTRRNISIALESVEDPKLRMTQPQINWFIEGLLLRECNRQGPDVGWDLTYALKSLRARASPETKLEDDPSSSDAKTIATTKENKQTPIASGNSGTDALPKTSSIAEIKGEPEMTDQSNFEGSQSSQTDIKKKECASASAADDDDEMAEVDEKPSRKPTTPNPNGNQCNDPKLPFEPGNEETETEESTKGKPNTKNGIEKEPETGENVDNNEGTKACSKSNSKTGDDVDSSKPQEDNAKNLKEKSHESIEEDDENDKKIEEEAEAEEAPPAHRNGKVKQLPRRRTVPDRAAKKVATQKSSSSKSADSSSAGDADSLADVVEKINRVGRKRKRLNLVEHENIIWESRRNRRKPEFFEAVPKVPVAETALKKQKTTSTKAKVRASTSSSTKASASSARTRSAKTTATKKKGRQTRSEVDESEDLEAEEDDDSSKTVSKRSRSRASSQRTKAARSRTAAAAAAAASKKAKPTRAANTTRGTRKRKASQSSKSTKGDADQDEIEQEEVAEHVVEGRKLVGKRLSVFRPIECSWFSGRITAYEESPKKAGKHHCVLFDNGEEIWVDLLKERCIVENVANTTYDRDVSNEMIVAAVDVILRSIQNWGEHNFCVHPKGVGVICVNDDGIQKGDILGSYHGELYPLWLWEQKEAREDALRKQTRGGKASLPDFWNMRFEIPSSEPNGFTILYVDSKHYGTSMSRLSHSCRPNACVMMAVVDGKYNIAMRALRDIEPGEEVTIDYNCVTDSMDEFRAAICLCGSEGCRGSFLYITGAQQFMQVVERRHRPIHRAAMLFEASLATKEPEKPEKPAKKTPATTSKRTRLTRRKRAPPRIMTGKGKNDTHPSGLSQDCVNRMQRYGVKLELIDTLPLWALQFVALALRFVEQEQVELPSRLFHEEIARREKVALSGVNGVQAGHGTVVSSGSTAASSTTPNPASSTSSGTLNKTNSRSSKGAVSKASSKNSTTKPAVSKAEKASKASSAKSTKTSTAKNTTTKTSKTKATTTASKVSTSRKTSSKGSKRKAGSSASSVASNSQSINTSIHQQQKLDLDPDSARELWESCRREAKGIARQRVCNLIIALSKLRHRMDTRIRLGYEGALENSKPTFTRLEEAGIAEGTRSSGKLLPTRTEGWSVMSPSRGQERISQHNQKVRDLVNETTAKLVERVWWVGDRCEARWCGDDAADYPGWYSGTILYVHSNPLCEPSNDSVSEKEKVITRLDGEGDNKEIADETREQPHAEIDPPSVKVSPKISEQLGERKEASTEMDESSSSTSLEPSTATVSNIESKELSPLKTGVDENSTSPANGVKEPKSEPELLKSSETILENAELKTKNTEDVEMADASTSTPEPASKKYRDAILAGPSVHILYDDGDVINRIPMGSDVLRRPKYSEESDYPEPLTALTTKTHQSPFRPLSDKDVMNALWNDPVNSILQRVIRLLQQQCVYEINVWQSASDPRIKSRYWWNMKTRVIHKSKPSAQDRAEKWTYVPKAMQEIQELTHYSVGSVTEARDGIVRLRDLVLTLPGFAQSNDGHVWKDGKIEDAHQKLADLLTFYSHTENWFHVTEAPPVNFHGPQPPAPGTLHSFHHESSVVAPLLGWLDQKEEHMLVEEMLGTTVLPEVESAYQPTEAAKYASHVRAKIMKQLGDDKKRYQDWDKDARSMFTPAPMALRADEKQKDAWPPPLPPPRLFGSPVLDAALYDNRNFTGSDSGFESRFEDVYAKKQVVEEQNKPASAEGDAIFQNLLTSLKSTRRSTTRLSTEETQMFMPPPPPTVNQHVWIQCDGPDCEKWRKLPAGYSASDFPEKFNCSMLKRIDPQFASCSVPEEPSTGETSLKWGYGIGTVDDLTKGHRIDAYHRRTRKWYAVDITDARADAVQVVFPKQAGKMEDWLPRHPGPGQFASVMPLYSFTDRSDDRSNHRVYRYVEATKKEASKFGPKALIKDYHNLALAAAERHGLPKVSAQAVLSVLVDVINQVSADGGEPLGRIEVKIRRKVLVDDGHLSPANAAATKPGLLRRVPSAQSNLSGTSYVRSAAARDRDRSRFTQRESMFMFFKEMKRLYGGLISFEDISRQAEALDDQQMNFLNPTIWNNNDFGVWIDAAFDEDIGLSKEQDLSERDEEYVMVGMQVMTPQGEGVVLRRTGIRTYMVAVRPAVDMRVDTSFGWGTVEEVRGNLHTAKINLDAGGIMYSPDMAIEVEYFLALPVETLVFAKLSKMPLEQLLVKQSARAAAAAKKQKAPKLPKAPKIPKYILPGPPLSNQEPGKTRSPPPVTTIASTTNAASASAGGSIPPSTTAPSVSTSSSAAKIPAISSTHTSSSPLPSSAKPLAPPMPASSTSSSSGTGVPPTVATTSATLKAPTQQVNFNPPADISVTPTSQKQVHIASTSGTLITKKTEQQSTANLTERKLAGNDTTVVLTTREIEPSTSNIENAAKNSSTDAAPPTVSTADLVSPAAPAAGHSSLELGSAESESKVILNKTATALDSTATDTSSIFVNKDDHAPNGVSPTLSSDQSTVVSNVSMVTATPSSPKASTKGPADSTSVEASSVAKPIHSAEPPAVSSDLSASKDCKLNPATSMDNSQDDSTSAWTMASTATAFLRSKPT